MLSENQPDTNPPRHAPYKIRPASERFWKYVQTSDDCWIWNGGRTAAGYGRFEIVVSLCKYKVVMAHRFAYEMIIGPIPEGLDIDHIECSNPSCVNPAHMICTTLQENNLRSSSICAINKRKTACLRGHAFDEENTGFYKNGNRFCKTCKRGMHLKYDHARKGTTMTELGQAIVDTEADLEMAKYTLKLRNDQFQASKNTLENARAAKLKLEGQLIQLRAAMAVEKKWAVAKLPKDS